jgi:hypothetical protein
VLNPTSLLADALGRDLAETYRRSYGDQEPHLAAGLDEAARLVIERIASSDALYHDVQHTTLVTLCVQDILRAGASSGSSHPAIGPIPYWPRWSTTSAMSGAPAPATQPRIS